MSSQDRLIAPGGRTTEAVPPISDSDFADFGRIIRERTGIVLNDSKRWMLALRLTREIRRLGLPDLASYRRLLASPQAGEARDALTSAVTTNVTSFFRGPEQFEALAALVPELRERARQGGRLRIWSAGCSTGQEPVSIAMTLLDHWPDAARADLRILATDIDAQVIARAQSGLYDARTLEAEIPAEQRHHFTQSDPPAAGMLSVSPQIAALIRYRRLNLHDPWPFRGLFDIIFCRNVVIYFDAESRRRLWQRLAGQLVPGGRLFVGHSERIDPALVPILRPEGVTRYRRSEIAAPLPPLAAAGRDQARNGATPAPDARATGRSIACP